MKNGHSQYDVIVYDEFRNTCTLSKMCHYSWILELKQFKENKIYIFQSVCLLRDSYTHNLSPLKLRCGAPSNSVLTHRRVFRMNAYKPLKK